MALKNVRKTQVSNSMAGKSVLLFGQSRTGKTSQACKFPKPLVLAFENGLRSIPGVAFVPITKWSEFISTLKELSPTNPDEQKALQDEYATIVLDELSVACDLCSEFVCQQYGVNSISEGNSGYGLWKELDAAFSKQMRILMNLPFTIVIIGHDGEREFPNPQKEGETITKIYPAGNKRLVPFAVHACDVIAYLKPNGLDSDGKEIPSSAIMAQTNEVYAGSRFTYLPPALPVFSADALTEAIKSAVDAEEKTTGIKSVSFEEQQKNEAIEHKSAAELKEEIRIPFLALCEAGRKSEFEAIVETYLGKGSKINSAKDEQYQMLEAILAEARALLK